MNVDRVASLFYTKKLKIHFHIFLNKKNEKSEKKFNADHFNYFFF